MILPGRHCGAEQAKSVSNQKRMFTMISPSLGAFDGDPGAAGVVVVEVSRSLCGIDVGRAAESWFRVRSSAFAKSLSAGAARPSNREVEGE